MGDARFVSLGGVWLDDIQIGGQTVHRQVLGGSVTFGECSESRTNVSHIVDVPSSNARSTTVQPNRPLKHPLRDPRWQ